MASIVTIQNTSLVLKNFSGEIGRYFNTKGGPEFAVVLPADLAAAMTADGWNVKQFRKREEDTEEPDFFIKVKVGVKGRPPRMVMINSSGRVDVDIAGCSVFDFVKATNVDISLTPYAYNVNGDEGISAYLNSLFVTVEEDELDRKYASIPQAGSNNAGAYQFPDEEPGF